MVAGLMMFGAGCTNPGPSDDSVSVESGESACVRKTSCVDKAIKNLGIDMNMRTTPSLVAEILHDDMLLADLPAARALFEESLAKPVSL